MQRLLWSLDVLLDIMSITSETYYILSGKGIYSDNGTLRMVSAGDVTFTPDGKGHGLTNSGDEDLVFMALIILD